MMAAMILLLIFVIAYIIIIEIFTVLFRFTGLTEETARFQVISLLTASGFTTAESEVVTTTRRRRKLAMLTMLFGYTFSVIIVSLIVNFFVELSSSEVNNLIGGVIALIVVFVFSFILIKIHIKEKLDHLVQRLFMNYLKKHQNAIMLIDVLHKNVLASVLIDHLPKELESLQIKEMQLKKKYNIQILAINRHNKMIDMVHGDMTIHQGDILIVYGSEVGIHRLFDVE